MVLTAPETLLLPSEGTNKKNTNQTTKQSRERGGQRPREWKRESRKLGHEEQEANEGQEKQEGNEAKK